MVGVWLPGVGGRTPGVVAYVAIAAIAVIVAMASAGRGHAPQEPVYSVAQILVGRARGRAAWTGRTVLVRGRLVGICDYSYATYAARTPSSALCPRMLAPDMQAGAQVTVRPSSYGPHMAYISVLGAVLSLDGGPMPAPNPLIAALAHIPVLSSRVAWSSDQFVQQGIYRVRIGDNQGSRCVRAAVCFDAQLLIHH